MLQNQTTFSILNEWSTKALSLQINEILWVTTNENRRQTSVHFDRTFVNFQSKEKSSIISRMVDSRQTEKLTFYLLQNWMLKRKQLLYGISSHTEWIRVCSLTTLTYIYHTIFSNRTLKGPVRVVMHVELITNEYTFQDRKWILEPPK